MSDDNVLHVGERQRAWFRVGPDDPAGPYSVSFRNLADVDTAWATLTAGVDQKGVAGLYCWVATAGVAGTADSDTILTEGLYLARGRYVGGGITDIDELGPLVVRR